MLTTGETSVLTPTGKRRFDKKSHRFGVHEAPQKEGGVASVAKCLMLHLGLWPCPIDRLPALPPSARSGKDRRLLAKPAFTKHGVLFRKEKTHVLREP